MEPSRRSSHQERILLLVWWSVTVGVVNSAQVTDGRTPGLSLWHYPHPPGLRPISQHPLRPPAPGQWAPWGSWSTCSSQCDEGASLRTRRCIRLQMERHCAGEGRQYRVCIMQACPPDVIPFRDMQCALYNSKPVLRDQERYEWVPFLGAPNPCDLSCRAVGHSFYHTFGRVLDGTKCLADSEGMCINGRCLVAGCDGVLGSSVSEDKCGRCQGRKSACVFIQRVFRAAFPSSGYFGYKNVTRIPAGATHVKVTDRSRNLLALMNARRRYVINGEWAVSWPGVYEVAGTQVHYTRSPDDHEVMEALGPTEEDLHVMLLFQEQNPGVEYEYWLPRDRNSTFQGGASSLRQPQPRQVDMGFWNTAPPDQKRATSRSESIHTPERSAGGCGECKKVSDKSQQIQSYCQSDFVFRARIVKKRLSGHETRYDVRVKHSYKKRYPIVHREYIWVPDTCDCPRLLERRDYLLMVRRHPNSERIVLDRHSYTALWTPREVLKLQDLQRHCTSEGMDASS